jgi:hypothetical protein
LRAFLSAAALYFVFRQLDIPALKQVFSMIDPGWAFLAVGAYVLSKVISAFRLSFYLRGNSIGLTESQNLKLYFIGMFYNLFLPGGIGGDAYKVWLLHRDWQAAVGKSVQALLLDRISGLSALAVLGLLFAWFAFPEIPYNSLLPAGSVLLIPAMYAVHYFAGKQFMPVTVHTTFTSLVVQLVQVVCAWALLRSLHIHDHTTVYLAVFLLSSLVSVLPVSIGGIGLRELVFVTAAGYAPISPESSVAFSLVFFVVTAASSLPGAFISLRK